MLDRVEKIDTLSCSQCVYMVVFIRYGSIFHGDLAFNGKEIGPANLLQKKKIQKNNNNKTFSQ